MDPEVERAEPGQEYMVMWRDSDVFPTEHGFMHQGLKRGLEQEGNETASCYADGLGFNSHPDHPVYAAMRKRSLKSFGSMDFSNIFRRQSDQTGGNSAGVNLETTIGQTAGCPTTRKVALVGVATDCTYTGEFNSTESARENVIQVMNAASAVWENTFNISLGLANLTISDAQCPGTPSQNTAWNQGCSDSVQIQDRLNLFSAWRGQQRDSNSHWTLLSTCNTGTAVGLAWLGQACVNDAIDTNATSTGGDQTGSSGSTETVAGANVVVRTRGAQEWQVIAHETGHTFGAVHDCDTSACNSQTTTASQQCCPLSSTTCNAGGQYIMNPSSTTGIDEFSPCTVGNICSAFLRNSVKTDCLSNNRDVQTITGEQCGNGIVEGDEECDCGGTEGCGDNSCCDATTCKYKNNSVCDDSNEDCCRDCQFASSGTVCRASTSDCDTQEVCPGDSAICPADTFLADGDDCGSGLQCASGQCTSRDQQCKSVMGSYTQGNDTYACDSSSCVVTCGSPEFGPNVCYSLQQNFLDGTQCSGGGTCQNGRCRGASVGGQVSSWIDDHKAIVIGVCAGVGGLILFAILGCIVRSCRRRRANKKFAAAPAQPPPGGWQGWQGGRQPQMAQHGGGYNQQQQPHPNHGWAGGASGGYAPPPPPAPTYPPRARYM